MDQTENNTGLTCPRCGYNLTALTTSRCPECGQPFKIVDPTEPESVSSGKGIAFLKSGAYGLGGFIVLGLACALVGGRVHIDLCGATGLFVVCGLVGLLIRAIYNRGYRRGKVKDS